MDYFTLKVHRRLLECHFGVLECCKTQNKPIFKNFNIFEKYPKGGPLEKKFLVFFLTQNLTMEYQRRLLECHLGVLQC